MTSITDTLWQWLEEPGYITVTVAVATLVLVVYYIFTCYKADTWEKYGVKHVVMGKEAFSDFRIAIHKLMKEHGQTIGTSHGYMFLFTTDLELLRMIMVKDFNNFVDREEPFYTKSNMRKGVFFLEGHDWKRVRQVITPSFSSGKIKSFTRTVNESATKLTKVMEDCAREEKPVAIKYLAGQYTSEIIARLAFGLHTDCIGKEDDEFTHFAKKFFKIRTTIGRILMLVAYRFPQILPFLVKNIGFFDEVNPDSDVYFDSVLRKTVAERQELARNGKKLHNDFLQNLVVAKEEGDKAVAAAATTSGSADTSEETAPKTLTDEELYGQAMLILFAGFETTSTTLQFCLYLLAKHPHVQEKLYEEITSVLQSDEPTYEELGELKYTDRVINETLRLYSPVPIMGRRAKETKTYGNITIPKGSSVIIPFDLIMMDPKNYEDPEKFDPDRFTEENKAKRDPMAFLPFGYGPRICPGMRLALLELKVALVSLIRKVRFDMDEKMKEEKPNLIYQGFILVENPILLTVRLRE